MQIGFEAWIKLVDWAQPFGLEGCKFYLVPIEARKEADTRGWCSSQSSSAGWELETRVFSASWESEHQLNKKSWSPEIIFFKPVRLQKVIFFTTAPKNIPKCIWSTSGKIKWQDIKNFVTCFSTSSIVKTKNKDLVRKIHFILNFMAEFFCFIKKLDLILATSSKALFLSCTKSSIL